jgi:hypothetical protein
MAAVDGGGEMSAGGGAEAMTGGTMSMAIVPGELPVAERRMAAGVDMRVAAAGAGVKPHK